MDAIFESDAKEGEGPRASGQETHAVTERDPRSKTLTQENTQRPKHLLAFVCISQRLIDEFTIQSHRPPPLPLPSEGQGRGHERERDRT